MYISPDLTLCSYVSRILLRVYLLKTFKVEFVVLIKFFIVCTILCAPLFTTCCKQQLLLCSLFLFTLLCINNSNCLTNVCKLDLQTTITFFKRIMSSHKADWIFTDPLPALNCLLYRMVNSLKNALEDKWLCLSRNLYKCKHVVNMLFTFILVCFYITVYIYSCSLCFCIFVYLFISFFILVFCWYILVYLYIM